MSGPLVFGMIFKAIDQATSPIRGITEAMKGPILVAGKIAQATAEASEKFAGSFAGIGSMVAEGFSLKEVAGVSEYFKRLQIDTGLSDHAIEHLKETLMSAAGAARISSEDFLGAFKKFKANGGSIETFEHNAGTIAASMQLMKGHGEELGEMFASLDANMGVFKADQVLSTVATMRQQFLGLDGGLAAYAARAKEFNATYAALGHRGAEAATEVSGLYAMIAKGTHSTRQAGSLTESMLGVLGDRHSRLELASKGIRVFNRDNDESSGVRGLKDIVGQIAGKYAANPFMAELMFGREWGEALKLPIAEIHAGGKSGTLDKMFDTKADPAKFLGDATEASKTLSGSLDLLKTKLAEFGEHNLAGPIELFAQALSAVTGPVASVLMALAGFAFLGHVVGWFAGAVKGVMAFGEVLGMLQIGTLVTKLGTLGRMILFVGEMGAFGMGQALMGLVPAIMSAVAATWAWTVALLADPITWVVLAIVAAVAAIGAAAYAIYSHWGAVRDFFRDLWGGVVSAFSAFSEWLKTSFGIDLAAIAGRIADAFAPMADIIKGVLTRVVAVFDWAWSKISAVIDGIGRGVHVIGDALGISGGESSGGSGGHSSSAAAHAPAAAPSAIPHHSTEVTGEITIKFEGLPEGVTVTATSTKGKLATNVDLGVTMLGMG